jgi:hypothetical protein
MYRLFYPEEMRVEEARRTEELRLLATEWQNRAERKGGPSNPKDYEQPKPKHLSYRLLLTRALTPSLQPEP